MEGRISGLQKLANLCIQDRYCDMCGAELKEDLLIRESVCPKCKQTIERIKVQPAFLDECRMCRVSIDCRCKFCYVCGHQNHHYDRNKNKRLEMAARQKLMAEVKHYTNLEKMKISEKQTSHLATATAAASTTTQDFTTMEKMKISEKQTSNLATATAASSTTTQDFTTSEDLMEEDVDSCVDAYDQYVNSQEYLDYIKTKAANPEASSSTSQQDHSESQSSGCPMSEKCTPNVIDELQSAGMNLGDDGSDGNDST